MVALSAKAKQQKIYYKSIIATIYRQSKKIVLVIITGLMPLFSAFYIADTNKILEY